MKTLPPNYRPNVKKCVKAQADLVRHIYGIKQKRTSDRFAEYKKWLTQQNLALFNKGLTASFLFRMVDTFERDIGKLLKELKRHNREWIIAHLNCKNN